MGWSRVLGTNRGTLFGADGYAVVISPAHSVPCSLASGIIYPSPNAGLRCHFAEVAFLRRKGPCNSSLAVLGVTQRASMCKCEAL